MVQYNHLMTGFVAATVTVAALGAGQAQSAIYSAPANMSSVVLAATWAGSTFSGPGTWVRDFYAGNGDGQSGLFPYLIVGQWDGTFRAPVFRVFDYRRVSADRR